MSGILKKIKEIQQSSDDEAQQSSDDFVDEIEMILNMLPEFLLVRHELDIKKVLELASQYRKMSLMDAFYKVPVLMELVDVAIRKIT